MTDIIKSAIQPENGIESAMPILLLVVIMENHVKDIVKER